LRQVETGKENFSALTENMAPRADLVDLGWGEEACLAVAGTL